MALVIKDNFRSSLSVSDKFRSLETFSFAFGSVGERKYLIINSNLQYTSQRRTIEIDDNFLTISSKAKVTQYNLVLWNNPDGYMKIADWTYTDYLGANPPRLRVAVDRYPVGGTFHAVIEYIRVDTGERKRIYLGEFKVEGISWNGSVYSLELLHDSIKLSKEYEEMYFKSGESFRSRVTKLLAQRGYRFYSDLDFTFVDQYSFRNLLSALDDIAEMSGRVVRILPKKILFHRHPLIYGCSQPTTIELSAFSDISIRERKSIKYNTLTVKKKSVKRNAYFQCYEFDLPGYYFLELPFPASSRVVVKDAKNLYVWAMMMFDYKGQIHLPLPCRDWANYVCPYLHWNFVLKRYEKLSICTSKYIEYGWQVGNIPTSIGTPPFRWAGFWLLDTAWKSRFDGYSYSLETQPDYSTVWTQYTSYYDVQESKQLNRIRPYHITICFFRYDGHHIDINEALREVEYTATFPYAGDKKEIVKTQFPAWVLQQGFNYLKQKLASPDIEIEFSTYLLLGLERAVIIKVPDGRKYKVIITERSITPYGVKYRGEVICRLA